MKNTLQIILSAFFILILTYNPCEAKRDTLVVSMGTQPIKPLNPAYTTSRQILVLYHNWGDTLLYRDPVQRKIVPCLAESYRFIDPGTIELKLRKGVRFHNGEPFDARAVKFSLDLLKRPASKVSHLLAGLKKVDVVDDHTVRIHTSTSNPTVLELIANVLFIYPPDYYSEAGKDGFEKHPVGTGPYRFVSRKNSSEVLFRANPDYFVSPKGKAGISNLKAVTVPEEILQIQALVSGQADMTRSTSFYQEQIPFAIQSPDLEVKSVGILRTLFLCMDAAGRSGVNFFKEKRVRMAVNHAINKERIVKHLYNGFADTANSVTGPLHFGHEPDVMEYPYDPDKARKLLAEAGYPNGFTVDFFAAVNESAAESINRDLEAVGIKTNFKWMGGRWSSFYKKFLRGEMPMAFLTWGSYSIFDAGAIMNPFFMEDAPGSYGTTPEVSRMLKEANNSIDQKRRKELFSEALKIVAQEAFWVPICSTQAISIMNKDLDFQPSYDEIDRYFTATWK